MVLFAVMEDGTKKSLGHICNTEPAVEVRRVLDLVGDKWTLLVIALLGDGPHRFTALQREIGSISRRMLTLTLRQLERNGLVLRTVYPVVPPHVEYQLTPLGYTLMEAIQGIVTWTVAHHPELADARAAYDARADPVAGSIPERMTNAGAASASAGRLRSADIDPAATTRPSPSG